MTFASALPVPSFDDRQPADWGLPHLDCCSMGVVQPYLGHHCSSVGVLGCVGCFAGCCLSLDTNQDRCLVA